MSAQPDEADLTKSGKEGRSSFLPLVPSGPPLPRTTPTPHDPFDAASTTGRRLLIVLGARLAVATLLLIATSMLASLGRIGATEARTLYWVVGLLYATSLLHTMAHRIVANPSRLASAQVLSDLILTTFFVHYTGGPSSGFVFLYPIVTLTAAALTGPQSTLVATAIAGLLYSLDSFVWVQQLPADVGSLAGRTEHTLALSRNLFALILVAALATMLSARVRRAAGELHAATENAASYAKLTEDIIRSLNSGLMTADLRGVVQFVNDAGVKMYRSDPNRMVGQSIADLLPVANAAPSTDEEGLLHRGEGRTQRSDGSIFPVGFSQTPLVSKDGVVTGSLVLFQDLTELHALRDKAARADRLAVLGTLSASLAHEIRNPLGAIGGSVELVRDSVIDADDRRLLSVVLGEVERLTDLVNAMLDYGKPIAPDPTSFDLTKIVVDVVSMLERAHSVRGRVKFVVDAPQPVHCFADPTQIRQVLWNLFRNAVQFSPDGGTVSAFVSNEGERACCVIEDDGPGITAGEELSIFEVFYTKKHQGTGIGLAIAKQIVEAHHGEIRATRGSKGARFETRLPNRRSSTSPGELLAPVADENPFD